MLTYSLGNVASAHETPWLAVNNFYWMGIFQEDIEKISKGFTFRSSGEELEKARELLSRHNVKNRPKLKVQLENFLENKKKIDIGALAYRHFEYLSDYIINKIQGGDSIKI